MEFKDKVEYKAISWGIPLKITIETIDEEVEVSVYGFFEPLWSTFFLPIEMHFHGKARFMIYKGSYINALWHYLTGAE